jgi:predicted RND superfamily exporter protein
MNSILRLLRSLVQINIRHPYVVLFVAVGLAVFTAVLALKLKVDTDIANLLPKSYNSVRALDRLQETVGGEIDMQVAIVSPSFEDNKRFAEDLIDVVTKAVYDRKGELFFERAEFRKETDILKDNALFLATHHELDAIKRYLTRKSEEVKLEANPFYFDLGLDDEEDTLVDPEQDDDLRQFEASYEAIIPNEYPISADSTVMVVKFYPTGSKSDIRFLRDMFFTTDSIITALDPSAYNAEMKVSYGGRLMKHLMELDSIMKDVFSSFASGISSVLLVVMVYFFTKKYVNYRRGSSAEQTASIWSHIIRAPVPLLVIGLPLIISLSYTFGLAYIALGMLNTMTSVLFVILFGMGIDYGIHYYARYLEIRSTGLSVEDSLLSTYDSTGSAIMTSALTTAAALYVLMIADFRGFSEFGFISGTGILLAFFCMLFVMPALIVICEKMGFILVNQNKPTDSRDIDKAKYPFSRTIVAVGTVITVIVLFYTPNLRFEYDFGLLEPEFTDYQEFSEITGKVFRSQRRNPAYVIADTDQEVNELLSAIRFKIENDTINPVIDEVEALQERFPVTDSAVQTKLDKISDIRDLLDDPFLSASDDEYLDKLRRASKTVAALQINEVPDYLKARFVTKDGQIGRFVIIYPDIKLNLGDGRNSIAFKNAVGEITTDSGKTFHAASTSIVAADMLDLMLRESPYMVSGTAVLIFILMFIAFRSYRWTIISLVPLLMGLLFTFGIMLLFDVKFNFYNIIVLPAILGIGEDSGVHLAKRYIEEGRDSMWKVLSSTGQHVTIGSLTTMLGFSGLLFTSHPGLYSIGFMATVGIGMTWLTSVAFLPALIQVLENRNWIRF